MTRVPSGFRWRNSVCVAKRCVSGLGLDFLLDDASKAVGVGAAVLEGAVGLAGVVVLFAGGGFYVGGDLL